MFLTHLSSDIIIVMLAKLLTLSGGLMAKPCDLRTIEIASHKANIDPEAVKYNIHAADQFTILHVNIRSFNLKMSLLETLLAEIDIIFSCIVVSETWFSSNTFLNNFAINGYNLFCSSRPGGGGGGICIYVMDQFETSVTEVRLEGAESLLVRTFCGGRPVCAVLPVYRTPSASGSAFLADFEVCVPTLPTNSIIVGDLNFDLNTENEIDNCALNYQRIMNLNGFYNIVQSPTRYSETKISLLDHIFVNNSYHTMSSCTINSDILADHKYI